MEYDHRITLKEIQELEYNILKEFDAFAKENNIKYFLCGGTLLGAIRHEGFIPWDDDIDICLLREDYDRMISLVREKRTFQNKPQYRFCLPLDDNYIYPYVKIVDDHTIVYEKDINHKFCLGVWIDIFPMDSWPESKKEIGKVLKKHSKYKFFNKIYVAGHLSSIQKKIIGTIGKIGYAIICHGKTYKYWVSKMLSLIEPSQSEIVGNRAWPNKDKEMFNKKIFEQVEYKKFVDQEFPVPSGYHDYLTRMYGNYMEIPKPEDRIYHDFEGYVLKR
ncbi:MAG: phosphorylcholine transferase LicD [Faecalibacillus sp.]